MTAKTPPFFPQPLLRRAFAACLATVMCAPIAIAEPAIAAPPEVRIANNVTFFQRVTLGDLELSAVNIFFDERCADREFCFRQDTMVISVVLFTDQGLREVVLRLGERVRVPGGDLVLTNAGTPPSRLGAIPLENYRLQLVFIADQTPAQMAAQTGAR